INVLAGLPTALPPSAPTHPEFRVGVDVTRDGAHVVVLRCEGDAGEVIYSELHPLRAPPSAPVGVEARWKVGRFRSPHSPERVALVLSVGAGIGRDEQHHGFIGWVYAHPAQQPAGVDG